MHIGAKYHKANDAVRIILRDGSIKPLSSPSSVTELSEEGQEMCQYVSEVSGYFSHCSTCDLFLLIFVRVYMLWKPNSGSNFDN